MKMVNFGFFLTAIFTVLLTTSIQPANTLKCWNCENLREPFCGDRFDYSIIGEHDKINNYHDCLGQRCLKVVYDIGISQLVHRLCAKDDYDAQYVCDYLHHGSRCETCSTDGCNGATQSGPIALMIIIPMAIVKLLLHQVQ